MMTLGVGHRIRLAAGKRLSKRSMKGPMMTRRLLVLLAAAMLGVMAWMPAPVQAQAQQRTEQVFPPQPRRADKPPILWSYAAVVLILALVFGANTIPSKRGHQD
jgi:hypothetical protein